MTNTQIILYICSQLPFHKNMYLRSFLCYFRLVVKWSGKGLILKNSTHLLHENYLKYQTPWILRFLESLLS